MDNSPQWERVQRMILDAAVFVSGRSSSLVPPIARAEEQVNSLRDERQAGDQVPGNCSATVAKSNRTARKQAVTEYQSAWFAVEKKKRIHQDIAKRANPKWNTRDPVSRFLRMESSDGETHSIDCELKKLPPETK